MKLLTLSLLVEFLSAISACSLSTYPEPPRYDHIVIVVEENHSASEVMGSPYLSSLAARGAFLTRSYAVAHPSQPNYFALFSGSTQAVTDDAHYDISAPNLATALLGAGLSFAGYCEDLPAVGYRGDASGAYVRKHAPWASFLNVPGSVNIPFSMFPTTAFSSLPTVSFVIPNLQNDMHDGSIAAGDSWLATNIEGYARWAVDNNSLLVVTFDEGPGALPPQSTPIATILAGARVRQGMSDRPVTHYSLLRLVEDIYTLPYLGLEGTAERIVGIWY